MRLHARSEAPFNIPSQGGNVDVVIPHRIDESFLTHTQSIVSDNLVSTLWPSPEIPNTGYEGAFSIAKAHRTTPTADNGVVPHETPIALESLVDVKSERSSITNVPPLPL